MTCFGNAQPPYHARGLRQCLAELDRWAKKAAAIAAEMSDAPYWLPCELRDIEQIVRVIRKRLGGQPCPACNGSGWNPAVTDGMVPCEHCNGQGVVVMKGEANG